MGIVKTYDDKAHLQDAAVSFVADHLKVATKGGKGTTLFLSGGSTPGPVYAELSKQKLRWSKIAIAQVDDRWVSLSDPGSNATLLKKTILRNKAASAKFVRMKSRHQSAFSGQQAVEAKYRNLNMENSLAVLGMGGDGHVCSWFPNAQGLGAALDPANDNRVQAVMAKRSKVTGPYLERMTLTLSALNQCKSLLLLITGDEKRAVIDRALNDKDSDLPVAHLLRASGDRLTIMWAG